MLAIGREDRVLGLRPERAEHRRPEQEAGEQLPHDGRLPHSLHDLAHEAPDREQEDDLPKKDHLRGTRLLSFGGEGRRGGEERQRERRGRAQPVSCRGSAGSRVRPGSGRLGATLRSCRTRIRRRSWAQRALPADGPIFPCDRWRERLFPMVPLLPGSCPPPAIRFGELRLGPEAMSVREPTLDVRPSMVLVRKARRLGCGSWEA